MPSSTTTSRSSSSAILASAGGVSSSSSGSWEECGFVTHVVLVLLTAVYCSCLSTTVFSPDDDHSNELKQESRRLLLSSSSSFWISRETCHAIHSKWSVRIPLALTIAFWMAPVVYFFLNQAHATRLWKNQSFQIGTTRSATKNERDTTSSVNTTPSSSHKSSIPPICQIDLAIINSEIEARLHDCD